MDSYDILPVYDLSTAITEISVLLEKGITGICRMAAHAIAGRMTLEEWALAASKSIDKVKDRIVASKGLRYIGGTLKFEPAGQTDIKVSFALYFLDPQNNWHMSTASSSAKTSHFTEAALSEIRRTGSVAYDID